MDRTDFDRLVGKYKDRIFNTCLGFVKNHEDAEDLAQEVFIELYRKYNQFKGNADIGTWLYRIAVNKCMEHIRRNRTQKRKGETLSSEDAVNVGSNLFYHPGVSLENKERGAILFSAIDLLPENQKIAFTLQKVEGLEQREVSKIMKKSEGSVESLLQRAKENLRKKLKEYYEKG